LPTRLAAGFEQERDRALAFFGENARMFREGAAGQTGPTTDLIEGLSGVCLDRITLVRGRGLVHR
jgi:hypothetical protein